MPPTGHFKSKKMFRVEYEAIDDKDPDAKAWFIYQGETRLETPYGSEHDAEQALIVIKHNLGL